MPLLRLSTEIRDRLRYSPSVRHAMARWLLRRVPGDSGDTDYIARLSNFIRENHRYPNRKEDAAWGQDRTPKIDGLRIRTLRKVNLPDDVWKGGRGKNLVE